MQASWSTSLIMSSSKILCLRVLKRKYSSTLTRFKTIHTVTSLNKGQGLNSIHYNSKGLNSIYSLYHQIKTVHHITTKFKTSIQFAHHNISKSETATLKLNPTLNSADRFNLQGENLSGRTKLILSSEILALLLTITHDNNSTSGAVKNSTAWIMHN